MKLKDKIVVLTGAGRGIGKVVSEELARQGALLVLISRSETELAETLNNIKKMSNSSIYRVVDISDFNAVLNLSCDVFNIFGRVDCLVNNAGVQMPICKFGDTKLVDWKNNLNINLFGTINCTYAFLNDMVKKQKGKIINMSGGGSTSPRPNFSAYSVSKTAVIRFTETLAEEIKKDNIFVNAVAPGAVNTRMLDEIINSGESAGFEYEDALNRKKSGGTDPKLAAELISFLCSDQSDGITGKLISAQWDPWQSLEYQELLKHDKDLGTLRRIDNKSFFRK